jgi:hypothetical protein
MQSASPSQIEEVVQTYLKGYLGAESASVAAAFHPQTRLFSIDTEKLDVTEMPAWIDNLNSRRERKDIRKARAEISNIDITNDAAVAKVTLTFEKNKFTDYLSLLRIEGTWQIIGKIYTVESL